jgi:NAD(P)H-flavin reductase
MLPAVVRVRERRSESPGVFTLALEPPSKSWSALPGQFNMLYAFGVGEAAISLCGDLTEIGEIRHTIKAVGSVTNALARLGPGQALGLRGPFGSCWPLAECAGRDVVIITGGLGLPPLRPVIEHLLSHRAEFGQVVLLHGARSPSDVVYASELEQWRQQGAMQLFVTVDRGDSTWCGPVGLVTELLPRCSFDPERSMALLCGPEVMMRFAARELARRGMTDDRIYLSLERNMQCAIGLCGHCQLGPEFVCRDGPVFPYEKIKRFFNIPEA